MSQEGQTRRRARALSLLITAALLATSCATSQKDGGNVGVVAPQTQTAKVGTSAANANSGPSGLFTIYDGDAAPEESGEARERYAQIDENPFLEASRVPLSTFSIDVDTASYSNTRRFLNEGQLPPRDAVRIEELVNYFSYDYPQPLGDAPFSVKAEVADCPWNTRHRLVQIGLQGKRISTETMPPANLVFLVDVSGSMGEPHKLPLVKQGLRTLAEQLTSRDRVAIVTYAGASGLALQSTPGDRRNDIIAAIERMESGGSTNGGAGIKLAYSVAEENLIRGGTNRVVLATDGDFNVGVTGDNELVSLIERERERGVSLSVLGFGTGNLNDSMMEKLADHGNGNYAYIDSESEARKALGEQAAGTLLTIAKDVKIQVEFNPRLVAGYRLIGYENRLLAAKDFNDDRKDAGEIGAGHTVTALYEVVPAGQKIENPGVDELKYARPSEEASGTGSDELMTVKLRYKEPDGDVSKPLNFGVVDTSAAYANASADFKFAAAVASFGMLLRDSPHKGEATFAAVRELAEASRGADPSGYRAEFLELVRRAQQLPPR